MIQIVNTQSGEVFYNNKDKLSSLDYFICFEVDESGAVIDDTPFTMDQVVEQIKAKGGYLRYVSSDKLSKTNLNFDEDTVEYSQPGFSAAKDYYFSTHFIAVVNRTGSDSSIHVNGEDLHSFWNFQYLLETAYLANRLSRAVGIPPVRYAYFGNYYVSEVSLTSLSGVDADYYIASNDKVVAMAGIRQQYLPWLSIPKTEIAAKTVNAILKGTLNDKDGNKLCALVKVPSSQVGIVLTKTLQARYKSFLTKFENKAGSIDTNWALASAIPQPSYKDDRVTPLFYFSDISVLDESNTIPTGVMYNLKDCNPIQLQSDFKKLIKTNDVHELRYAYCFRSPNALNNFASTLSDRISAAQTSHLKAIIDGFNLSLNAESDASTVLGSKSYEELFREGVSTSLKTLNQFVDTNSTIPLDATYNSAEPVTALAPKIDFTASFEPIKAKLRQSEISSVNDLSSHLTNLTKIVKNETVYVTKVGTDAELENKIDNYDAMKVWTRAEALATKSLLSSDLSDDAFLDSYFASDSSITIDKTKVVEAVQSAVSATTVVSNVRNLVSSITQTMQSWRATGEYSWKNGNWKSEKYLTLPTRSILYRTIQIGDYNAATGKRRYSFDLVINPFEYKLESNFGKVMNNYKPELDVVRSFMRTFADDLKVNMSVDASSIDVRNITVKQDSQFPKERMTPTANAVANFGRVRCHRGVVANGWLWNHVVWARWIFNNLTSWNNFDSSNDNKTFDVPVGFTYPDFYNITFDVYISEANDVSIDLTDPGVSISNLAAGSDTFSAKTVVKSFIDNIDQLDEMLKSVCCVLHNGVYGGARFSTQFLNVDASDPTQIDTAISLLNSDDELIVRCKNKLIELRNKYGFDTVSKVYFFDLVKLISLKTASYPDVAPAILMMGGLLEI